MRTSFRVVTAVAALLPATAVPNAAPDCVDFGRPQPTATFVYRRSDSNGSVTNYTQRWTEFTAERASVSVTRGKVNEVVTNKHRIRDDVTLIAATASRNSNGGYRTDFRPAAVGDPMLRACAGRSWKIPAVTATYTEGARTTTAYTYAGTMRIVSLREPVRVPAGSFASVRYTRTLATPTGSSHDEYWKSIEHGVVVKHVSKLGNWTSTEELQAIR
jgi:hypothetical protein